MICIEKAAAAAVVSVGAIASHPYTSAAASREKARVSSAAAATESRPRSINHGPIHARSNETTPAGDVSAILKFNPFNEGGCAVPHLFPPIIFFSSFRAVFFLDYLSDVSAIATSPREIVRGHPPIALLENYRFSGATAV